jgi:polysaccharide biosynthesis/export protein
MKAFSSAQIVLFMLTLAAAWGCRSIDHPPPATPLVVVPPQSNAPRELAKVTMPIYVIEAPDILTIDAVRLVPKPPYRLQPLDVIFVEAQNVLPERPILGPFTVSPEGFVNLGIDYGMVRVVDLTALEARDAILRYLKEDRNFREPLVNVSLAEIAATQQIAGQHLVAPDGFVTLGKYGRVMVAGMTLGDAKAAIEAHLSQFLERPEVAVDVFAFNSKVYYIVTQGAGLGDNVVRLPLTGNETVLDAIAQVNGLQSVSSKKIWVARPVPGCNDNVVLPVDWCAVTGRGAAATNYQILPGDRVFIAEDKLVALDNGMAKVLSPVERVFGITLLGTSTAKEIKFFNNPLAGGF